MPRIFGSASTGSGGTPGGSTTQVQYNNAGAFGGVTGATTNGTFLTLTTPVLGVATGTSLALGGATLSTNALAVAGTGQITGKVYVGSAAPTSSNYALWKDGSNRLWVNADATNGTVSVGVADDYGVTYTGPAYAGGRGWRLNSDVTFGWSATNPLAALDTGLSRISAGVIGVGTGAQGSFAGTLQAERFGAKATGSVAQVDVANSSGSSKAGFYLGFGGVAEGASLASTSAIGWDSTTSSTAGTQDLFLRRGGAATLQHGAADAASPVAQTIKFQDVVAGTSNTAGVNATIQAPAGTGTGAGGSLIFQVAPAGSSGTAKNAWSTALTIDSTKLATFGGGVTATGNVTASYFRNGANQFHLYGTAGGIDLYNSTETLSFTLVPGASNLATFNGPIKALTTHVASLPAAGTIGRLAYVTDALAPTFLATVVGGGSVKTPVHDDGTNWVVG